MKSNAARVLLGIGLVALAVVLLVVLKNGGGGDKGGTTTASQGNAKSGGKSTKPAIPTIVVKNGEPVGGVKEMSFNEGDQIRFKVVSDADEEIHFHGYDIAKDVKAGGSVSFDVPATIEGIFEVELEGLGEQIAEIQVNP
jgi:hypothetical protein